jgi:ASC-1-like (ASCH) protein
VVIFCDTLKTTRGVFKFFFGQNCIMKSRRRKNLKKIKKKLKSLRRSKGGRSKTSKRSKADRSKTSKADRSKRTKTSKRSKRRKVGRTKTSKAGRSMKIEKEMATMNLMSPYFEQLGKDKEYEMRPLMKTDGTKRKQAEWNVGDVVLVSPNDGAMGTPYKVRITERHLFDTFRDALEMFGYEKFMPSQPSIEAAEAEYKGIANGEYGRCEKVGGVVVWKMERV